MKYKMIVDEGFTDKLDENITYQPGDKIKTEINEKRKEDLVARKLAHVVEEIDTTDKTKKNTKKEKEKEKENESVKTLDNVEEDNEPPVNQTGDEETFTEEDNEPPVNQTGDEETFTEEDNEPPVEPTTDKK